MPFTELHYENADLQLSTQYMFMARTWSGTIICRYMRTNCCPLGYQSEFPLAVPDDAMLMLKNFGAQPPFAEEHNSAPLFFFG